MACDHLEVSEFGSYSLELEGALANRNAPKMQQLRKVSHLRRAGSTARENPFRRGTVKREDAHRHGAAGRRDV